MGRKDLEKRIYTSHLNNFVAKVINKRESSRGNGIRRYVRRKKLMHCCMTVGMIKEEKEILLKQSLDQLGGM